MQAILKPLQQQLQLLLCVALTASILSAATPTAAAAAAAAAGPRSSRSNFDTVTVTASMQSIMDGELSPVNYWGINQAASPETIYNPAWLNVALNSTTVPIDDDAVEFGFGRIAGDVNVTVTLNIDKSGLAVYQIVCAATPGFGCVVTMPFAVTMNMRSDTLIGGSVDILSNNVSADYTPSFNTSAGLFTFTTGAFQEGENAIEGGGVRQMVFQMHEDGKCSRGDCCDTETGTIKSNGTVCRRSRHQCEAQAMCDGESSSCPSREPLEDGGKCLWVPSRDPLLGAFMSPPCDTTTIPATEPDSQTDRLADAALAALRQPSVIATSRQEPPNGWGRCTGQMGICTLDCSKGQCCYTTSPVVVSGAVLRDQIGHEMGGMDGDGKPSGKGLGGEKLEMLPFPVDAILLKPSQKTEGDGAREAAL